MLIVNRDYENLKSCNIYCMHIIMLGINMLCVCIQRMHLSIENDVCKHKWEKTMDKNLKIP